MRSILSIAVSFAVALVIVRPAMAGPALLFEQSNGKVLYAEDVDRKWHPASLTKIMTAYLAFEALKTGKLKLDSKIKCSANANAQQPSKIGLPVGAEISFDLALNALIIKSANDVAVMVAEAVAGSQPKFIALMNATAARLGMKQTNFVNPNGLPALQQVTTARDLALLAQAIIKDFPEHAHYWSKPSFRIGKRRLSTHNGLLKTFQGADGIKTGFICDSGFNVVASATREGKQIIVVVLGEPSGGSRTIRAASLLEHGFQQYGWKQLFNTTSIQNMPLTLDRSPIKSVRKTVKSWSCNHRSVKKRRKKRKAKKPVKKAPKKTTKKRQAAKK